MDPLFMIASFILGMVVGVIGLAFTLGLEIFDVAEIEREEEDEHTKL